MMEILLIRLDLIRFDYLWLLGKGVCFFLLKVFLSCEDFCFFGEECIFYLREW